MSRDVSEIESHTALRGIAAVLVVFFHYRGMLQPTFDVDLQTNFFAKGYLWVDFFFILSGYILSHVYSIEPGRNFGLMASFFRARFARIYPLHAATLLGLLLFELIVQTVTHKKMNLGTWPSFWLNIFDIHAWGFLQFYDWNFPSWSISAEFAAYLTFPMICIGIRRTPRLTFAFMVALVIVRLGYVATFEEREGWERWAIFRAIPMFCLGTILYRSREFIDRLGASITLLQAVATILIVLGLHFSWNDALLVVSFAALIAATQTDKGGAARILGHACFRKLGLWSYSIYMLHIPTSIIVAFTWPKLISLPLRLSDPVSQGLLPTVCLVITIVAGALSYSLFETPVRQLFRRPSVSLTVRRVG